MLAGVDKARRYKNQKLRAFLVCPKFGLVVAPARVGVKAVLPRSYLVFEMPDERKCHHYTVFVCGRDRFIVLYRSARLYNGGDA